MNTVDALDSLQAFSRVDSCGATNGSNVVTDPSILATDVGRAVTPAARMPGNGFVGAVTPGVSFTLVTAPGGAVPVSGTSTGAANMTISGQGWQPGGFYGILRGMGAAPPVTGIGYTIRFQGVGTQLRIGWVSFTAGTGGSFTSSVDGGGTTTVSCSGAGRGQNYTTITGLGAGTHTVDLTVTVATTPVSLSPRTAVRRWGRTSRSPRRERRARR